MASKIFSDAQTLKAVNDIVHPAVLDDFKAWASLMEKAGHPWALMEAAVMIENQLYKNLDAIIAVSLPREVRIARTMARDNATADMVIARMDRQADDATLRKIATYVIEPDDRHLIMPQIINIDKALRTSRI